MNRESGFTLLELLVALTVAAMAAALVVAMLGGAAKSVETSRARIAADRYDARVVGWFSESAGAIQLPEAPDRRTKFDPYVLEGQSLAPLQRGHGRASHIRWLLGREAGTPWRLEYQEDGGRTWTFELEGVEDARFVYLDDRGEVFAPGPQTLGTASRGDWPASIVLSLTRLDHEHREVVALEPAPRRPFILVEDGDG